jgi:hypothetical protein
MISNSAYTVNGFATEPSAVPVSVVPPGPVPGGSEPLPGIAVTTRATPGDASSRYLRTNSSQGRYCLGVWSRSPISTLRSTGPTENVALPWNFGPVTRTRAPIEIENVISPNQKSMVTPAEIRA